MNLKLPEINVEYWVLVVHYFVKNISWEDLSNSYSSLVKGFEFNLFFEYFSDSFKIMVKQFKLFYLFDFKKIHYFIIDLNHLNFLYSLN